MTQQLLTRSADETTPDLPTELDSTSSKLVYLYLRAAGACTVDELQASLDMKKISLYPLLKSLSKKGFVDSEGETYRLA
ncbi:helix-turn-helix domain-containing protein [Salinigranum halophilum]|jgi:predicted transcriptional regulator|uniref:helix-turn-helix domain-containing protein n=1 Tax=Salinigranum halophilum TaxID=2565931 RepID=UPI0010A83F79|nr:helix-turn-helix domain-containing protein [Salinigranum halophilum]